MYDSVCKGLYQPCLGVFSINLSKFLENFERKSLKKQRKSSVSAIFSKPAFSDDFRLLKDSEEEKFINISENTEFLHEIPKNPIIPSKNSKKTQYFPLQDDSSMTIEMTVSFFAFLLFFSFFFLSRKSPKKSQKSRRSSQTLGRSTRNRS